MEIGPRNPPSRLVPFLLGALLCAQVALTLFSFRTRDDLVNAKPILNVDFCSQYYWSHAAREFEKRSNRMWGYDPYFMAGYPLDFIANSSLPIQLVSVTFPSANLARVIKVCFIVSFALVPLILYFALRQFGLPPWPALSATALGAVSFWLAEDALFGRWGMISGAFVLSFFLVPLSLFMRFLQNRVKSTLILLFFTMPLAFLIHKTAFVLILPVAALWSLLRIRSLSLADYGKLAAVFVVALLLNWFWLSPFLRFLDLKVEDPTTTFFQNLDPWMWLKDLAPLPPFQPFWAIPLARIFILGTGMIGMFRLRREASKLFTPLVMALVFFGLLAYFGSFVPQLRHLQPYRYVTAYFYLWLPASGIGLKVLSERVAIFRGGFVWGPALFAAALIALLFLPSFRLFTRVAPLRTDLDRDSQALLEWVQANTDRSARLLIEDINAWEGKPIYGGARFPQMLPILADRELIGGPLPNAFIRHHYAAFQDGRLLDAPVAEFTEAKLSEAMDLYNIGWVVCWSDAAKARFASYRDAERTAQFGSLEAFTLKRAHNFFLAGAGRVEAGFDRLALSGLTTGSGEVVVSYHWVDGLTSEPPAALKPVRLGNDPVGFIGLTNPPPALVIRLGP